MPLTIPKPSNLPQIPPQDPIVVSPAVESPGAVTQNFFQKNWKMLLVVGLLGFLIYRSM